MSANNTFKSKLRKTLIVSLFNNYTDNVDTYRFKKNITDTSKTKSSFRKILSGIKTNLQSRKDFNKQKRELVSYFEYLYGLLEDDYSKELLVKVCAFRILGHKKVKLPMNSPAFWNTISTIENEIANKNDSIQIKFMNWEIFKYSLNTLGYPINIYLNACGVYYTFVYKCYVYTNGKTTVGIKEGDYVIDAGACHGDTALFFAHQAGKKGKIYSFEFVPENMEVLSNNLNLNSELKDHISVIRNPLWSKKGVPVYYKSNGPGTVVNMNSMGADSSSVLTTTIDELVSNGSIEKVDFIKMDIEGAETEALKGAENTLRKFKPRLAISLYHRPIDFKVIPEYLKSLDIGYKFYYNHYTMHAEESVLFCTIE